jgi:hypothetical protein
MIQMYRLADLQRNGYVLGKIAVNFPEDLSYRPKEFKEKSLVKMLTQKNRPGYLIYQIKFDPVSKSHYIEDFAVNCADISVDTAPLIRGFIPEGDIHMSEHPTLYEIMPKKKEIHVIPDPCRRLFYDAHKASNDPFCMVVSLDEVLNEFITAGFSVRHFAPGFNSLGNWENRRRYFKEEGHHNVKEGI